MVQRATAGMSEPQEAVEPAGDLDAGHKLDAGIPTEIWSSLLSRIEHTAG